MRDFQSILDQNVKGKRLLVRADLNVPLINQKVSDATRIERFASGMRPLLERGARLIILTHLGRPKKGPETHFSVKQLIPSLEAALPCVVQFASGCIGSEAETKANALQDGEVLLCENVRFEAGEENNDLAFAKALSKLGDLYVNDAFSCAHRAHASTSAIASLLPAYAGPLLMEELDALSSALEAPQSPAIAIVGGAKVSSKIAVLKNLVRKLDAVIIGGGMANTFLHAKGAPMGKSLHEADQVATVREIEALAEQHGCRLILPVDIVVAREFEKDAPNVRLSAMQCPADSMILDAGSASIALFEQEIVSARTVLWNGPLGAFEIPPFDIATLTLARRTAELCRDGKLVAIAGGGDTVAALNAADVGDSFTYVSSAGGAFLEWLEGKTLPGIAALTHPQKVA